VVMGRSVGVPDAITLLRSDHKNVEALFKRFEKAGPDARKTKRDLVDDMIRELSIHAEIEEQIFYPAVRAAEIPDASDMVLESLEEHLVAKRLLADLEKMDPEHERFDAKVTVLIENIRHHVDEEEGELFPAVREVLKRKALTELGDTMEEAKSIVATRPHPHSPDEPPGNILAGLAASAIDRTRDAGRSALDRARNAIT
jgi:hemerythrin superfamily protein